MVLLRTGPPNSSRKPSSRKPSSRKLSSCKLRSCELSSCKLSSRKLNSCKQNNRNPSSWLRKNQSRKFKNQANSSRPSEHSRIVARRRTRQTSLSGDSIRAIQTALGDSGFKVGRIDGLWGPETDGAVRKFQQSKQIPANCQLDQQTLSALGLNSAQFAQQGHGSAPNHHFVELLCSSISRAATTGVQRLRLTRLARNNCL
jgi:hypothetical protein